MADVQCGRFTRQTLSGDRRSTWTALLTPAPDSWWRATFDAEVETTRVTGAPPVADARLCGDTVVYSAEDDVATAMEAGIRDVIAKVNQDVATRQARQSPMPPGGMTEAIT